MRPVPVIALSLVLVAPLAAQDLERPPGWNVRFDAPDASEADLEMWVRMPPGWHITTGPAAIFWNPSMRAHGEFRVEMEVFLFDPGERHEAFGLFLGGRDLEGPGQEYVYFLIRNGGQFILKRRSGISTPTLEPWTAHEAIRSFSDRGDDASVRNVLAVEAREETVRFLVNGEEVARRRRAELPVDGIVGMRVNHALNLHVSRLDVIPLGGR